jgi:Na+-driven multidrug efflux pump
MATTYFQSIGASVRSILLSLSRQVIFLVPLMLWLPSKMGVDGVWTSFPISDILATVVCGILIAQSFRSTRARA